MTSRTLFWFSTNYQADFREFRILSRIKWVKRMGWRTDMVGASFQCCVWSDLFNLQALKCSDFDFQGANASQLEKEIGPHEFPQNEHYFGLVNVSVINFLRLLSYQARQRAKLHFRFLFYSLGTLVTAIPCCKPCFSVARSAKGFWGTNLFRRGRNPY